MTTMAQDKTPLPFYRSHVGLSAWHRQWVKGQVNANMKVPCGHCSVCCRAFGEGIPVSPLFDDVTSYRTHQNGHHLVLDVNADGSCVYLINDNCSIYERRPASCRAFDCRTYLLVPPIPKDVVNPGVQTLIDVAHHKFAFDQKEPDDKTLQDRFLALVYSMGPFFTATNAMINDVLNTALMRMAPPEAVEHMQRNVLKRMKQMGMGISLRYL